MWNRKLISTVLLGTLATGAIVQPASAVRTQDYTPEQFVAVLYGFGYAISVDAPIADARVRQAIRDFQVQYRLPIDGTLNNPTQNQAADLVRALQAGLNKTVKPSPQLPESQFFGEQTRRAVRSFQEQNGLPVTGVATLETRQRLNALLQDAIPPRPDTPTTPTESTTPAQPTAPPSNVQLEIYTEAQLKAILLGLGYDINANAGLSDPPTVRSIREVQSLYGLSETGQPDRATQNQLASIVRNLRNNLKTILQSNLPITRYYDNAARSAVREFQSRNKLPQTGVANLQVRSDIDRAARQRR